VYDSTSAWMYDLVAQGSSRVQVALNTRVKPHALPQRHILRAITTKRLRAVLFLFSSHRPSSILLTPKAKDILRLPLLLLSRQPTDSRFAREPIAADLSGSFLHLSALRLHPRSLTPVASFKHAFPPTYRWHAGCRPGFPVQPALRCIQALPARACQEHKIRP
jgi:hypothetical protein